MEHLEDRRMLSITVNSLIDELDGSIVDGDISLRDAIAAAPNGETIDFDATLNGGTILLTMDELEISDSVTIDASAIGGITIDADGQSGVFRISGSGLNVSLSSLMITGGNTIQGGGVYNELSTLTITECTISDNIARLYGGGICNYDGAVTIENSTISTNSSADNESSLFGGGIYNSQGTLSIINSSFLANRAEYGGGIYASGTLHVISSTIASNIARYTGGGISCNGDEIYVTNSTFVANSADHNGGGICHASGTGVVTNTTFVANMADRGGGIYNNLSDMLTVNNSVFAFNVADDGNSFCGTLIGHNNMLGLDPGFIRNPDAGADDVWNTEDDDYGDLHLDAASPAVNRGDNTLAVDGNGVPLVHDLGGGIRISDGQVDIGAYEFQGAPSPAREVGSTEVTILSDIVDSVDGMTSIREAIFYASQDQMGTLVTFDPGLSNGTILLGGQPIELYESVSIDAGSAGVITIDADGQSRVFDIHGGTTSVTLAHMIIAVGYTLSSGGGIFNNYSTLNVHDCTIRDNESAYGGGICNEYGTVTVSNTIFLLNTAKYYGGGIRNTGVVVADNCQFIANSAGIQGGGINNFSELTVCNSLFVANSAELYGCGLS